MGQETDGQCDDSKLTPTKARWPEMNVSVMKDI